MSRLAFSPGATVWVPWLIFAAAGATSLVGVPPPTALARFYFLAVLGGGLVAGARLLGTRTQVWMAAALLALTLAQRMIDRPVGTPPSSQWTVPLQSPGQVIRHTIRLPVATAEWQRWWRRASGAAAYVCARGPLSEADGVTLILNDDPVARLTQEQAYGPRPQPDSIGFYRMPLTRPQLEQRAEAVFELRRAPEATARPIDVCGTFSYRPTAGPDSSAFFDGATWTKAGPSTRGRFLIELRIEGPDGRPMVALY